MTHSRFGLEFGYRDPPCGDVVSPRPPQWWYLWVKNIHYLHFGVILFAISGVVSIIVSLVTPPIPEENLYRLTFWTRHSSKVRIDLDQDTQYNNTDKAVVQEGINCCYYTFCPRCTCVSTVSIMAGRGQM